MGKFSEEEIKYLSVSLPEEIKYYKYAGDFDGELAADRQHREEIKND